MKRSHYSQLAGFTAVLALAVVMLGAYVRLSDAGLGCPDWPGCYGRIGAPHTEQAISAANSAYPHRPVETAKAWKEMVHRYLAGSLGLLILLLTLLAWINRRRGGRSATVPTLLLGLVIFQALLGMWTVTLQVNPSIVTAHLIGGLATLALLWWLALREGQWWRDQSHTPLRLRGWAWLGLALVSAQVFLGGWTSTHYAALACTEFPTCHGDQWWPPTDFAAGFELWREVGINYEFGVLDSAARTAIHLTHRIGALVVLLYIGTLAALLVVGGNSPTYRNLGIFMGTLLLLQVTLGISNVVAQLPLPVAVAHNGGAALLLLSLITLIHFLTPAAAIQTGSRHGRSDAQTNVRTHGSPA